MKRILVWLLAICLLLGAAGCTGRNVPTDPTEAPQVTDAPQPTDAPTEAPQVTEAPTETEEPKPAVETGTYRLTVYTVGDVSFGEDRLKDLGIDNTTLTLNADHTGVFVLITETFDIQWTDDGQILIAGSPLYSMERLDADLIEVTMGDALLTMTKGEAPAEQPTEAPTDAPVEQSTAEPDAETPQYPGAPYGSSDGVVEHAKLLALYRWLDEMQSEFRYALTFDEIGAAVGKQGCDKRDNNGDSHSALWTDGNNNTITVTFRSKDGKWMCGAISCSGMTKNEWEKADISEFPRVGSSALSGTHETQTVSDEIKVGSTDTKVTVTAQVPTENWYPIERSNTVRYYCAPNAEKAENSQSYILVESKPSLEAINFYQEQFEECKELDACTIGGAEMQGRAYRYIGMSWIEYYGEIAENVWISIRMANVDFSAGTETEAIVMSLSFAV